MMSLDIIQNNGKCHSNIGACASMQKKSISGQYTYHFFSIRCAETYHKYNEVP